MKPINESIWLNPDKIKKDTITILTREYIVNREKIKELTRRNEILLRRMNSFETYDLSSWVE